MRLRLNSKKNILAAKHIFGVYYYLHHKPLRISKSKSSINQQQNFSKY